MSLLMEVQYATGKSNNAEDLLVPMVGTGTVLEAGVDRSSAEVAADAMSEAETRAVAFDPEQRHSQPAAAPEHLRWGARTVFLAEENPAIARRRWTMYAVAGGGAFAMAAAYIYVATASADAAGLPVEPLAPPVHALPVLSPGSEATPFKDSAESPPQRTVASEPREEMAATIESNDDPVIRVTRRAAAPGNEVVIANAYAAFLRGNLEAARAGYEEALRADEQSRNALLGLAALAVRAGDLEKGRALYRQLLDRDPGDPLAQAAMFEWGPSAEPRAQESQLRLLLTRLPENAQLHAALGRLFAREQRWAEARAAFAEAIALDGQGSLAQGSNDPDLAFNLAVSMEHLGERVGALEHYRAALAYAKVRRPGFDPLVAEARIRALSIDGGP